MAFIFVAILIAIASVVVSDLLIKDLAQEERRKMEIWSEATRVMTSENPSLNMNLILKIIQGNTSIPVILCDGRDSVVSYNNLEIPVSDVNDFLHKKVSELKAKN
ncbi:sensor histidine kinase, partial [gut metagenome]